ncbi:MAG TPA: hypothetical protein VGE47_08540 [Burkholderiaceae bacterium]
MSTLTQCTQALRQTLQWRLLLLWLIALALPTLLISLPLFIGLNQVLGRSLLASRLIENFDPAMLIEALGSLQAQGYSPASGVGGLIVFLLLLPFLSGSLLAVARAKERLGFGALCIGAWREYSRMSRLWLWGLLLLAAAIGIGAGLMNWAEDFASKQVLESSADLASRAALCVTILLLAFAGATLDAARARLALEPQRRSALKAWWLGTQDLLRQPSRLLVYVLLTLFGLALAAVIGWLRIQNAPVSTGTFIADLLLAQLLVAALVWARAARVLAFVSMGR